jgi:predicted DsbA family dithiol-disulfide isomerase
MIKEPVKIEMIYTMVCPNCRILKKLLDDVLPNYKNKFKFKRILANSPKGYIKTMKMNIHSVPVLLIEGKIVFKEVPTKDELIKTLNSY